MLSDDVFTNNSMSDVKSKQLHYYECLCCYLLYRQRFYDVHRTLYPLIKDYVVEYDYYRAENIFSDMYKVESLLNTISIIMHSMKVVPPNQAFIIDNMDIITSEKIIQIFQRFLSVNVLLNVLPPNNIKDSIQSHEKIVIKLCEENFVTQALNFCHHIKKLDKYGVEKLGKVGVRAIETTKTAIDVLGTYYQIILDKILLSPRDHDVYNDLKLGGRCTTSVSKMSKISTSVNVLLDTLCCIEHSPLLPLHKYVCGKLIDTDSVPLPLLNCFWKNSIDSIACRDNGDTRVYGDERRAYESIRGCDVALIVTLLLDKGKFPSASEVMTQFLEEIIAVVEKETTHRACEILLPNTVVDRLLSVSMSAGKIKNLLKTYYEIINTKFR